MNVADKTRNQINEGLAAIAAEVGASKEAVLGLLSLASNAGTNPASNIAKVARRYRALIIPSRGLHIECQQQLPIVVHAIASVSVPKM